ncbi:1,4-dihydroxy-2-naphthoate polyprenyltransferase [Agrococcus versicolor]|uniref:1,4-dihydroxy-2-naphthoate octaprenyltransferase n=1 Tax=Agrococcus versicolor TaxID=501482 RepID=A0ABN3ARM7_9MICO
MAKTRQAQGGRKQDASVRERSGNPARRGSTVRPGKRPPTLGDWIGATRPRTLPMSIAPVAVGTGAAYAAAGYHLGISLLCLAVAVLLQMGVNVANDYSDGIRGTDRDRQGPRRITTATAVEPRTVRTVALVLLGLGAAAGVALAIVSQQWWLLVVGAVCVALAWFYTGGKHPYGYYGLGEVVVFVVFGLIAVNGTVFATLGRWTEDSLVLSAAMGCFAAATMLVNNIRDIDSDRASGKRSVPTLIGRVAAKVLYGILMLVPFGILAIYALALAYGPFVLLTLAAAVPAVVIVAMGRTTRDYVTALGLTALTTLLFGLGTAVALWGGITGFMLG